MLCGQLIKCAAEEIAASAGKKRGLDSTLARTLRKFVQTAQDEHRSGICKPSSVQRPCVVSANLFHASVKAAEIYKFWAGMKAPLERRAARLFKHVSDVLDQVKLGSPIGGDYSAILRTYLLPEPKYCSRSSSTVFQGTALSA